MTDERGEREPLVSVVTPCYNAAPFVAETIESVLAQTHPSVEQIVVDDASTDGSWEVIERYVALHPGRVRGVRLEANRGGSHARNRGAELARGEMVMFLDADDVIAPDTLAALANAVRHRADGIAVCGWSRLARVDGAWVASPAEITPPDPAADPLREWLEGRWVATCSVLWRREVYERTGGWDEALTGNDDGDVMMRALADGARLVPASGGMSFYRMHGDSRVSASGAMLFSERVFGSFLDSLEKLEAQLARAGKLEEYLPSIGIAYARLPAAGFLQTHPELARRCLDRAVRYAAGPGALRPALGRTLPGRILSRLLGVEGKEKIAGALARLGIMTGERRRFRKAAALHSSRAASRPAD
jgi:glycosyltransferase involved in cell wall biosynthesis